MDQPMPHDAYESIAEDYAAARDDPPLRARCHELLRDTLPGPRVLEIGCGPGHDAAALAAMGLQVTAIDLCSAFIEYGNRTYPDVDFQRRDLREPGFAEEAFDGVLGLACFCHLSRTEVSTALVNIARILVPRGAVLLWLADSAKVSSYVVEDWGGVAGNRVEMICHDRTWISTTLGTAGFTDIEIIPVQSDYYDAIPRIRENAVEIYLARARTMQPPA